MERDAFLMTDESRVVFNLPVAMHSLPAPDGQLRYKPTLMLLFTKVDGMLLKITRTHCAPADVNL